MSLSRAAALIAIASLGISGCSNPASSGSDGDAVARSVTPVTEAERAGHQRMLELLRQVAIDSDTDNPFVGRNQPELIRADLAALPEGLPDLRRWLYNGLLAKHEMRLGNNERALEYALAAYRQLELFPDEIPFEEQVKTVFRVAVANLRLGETRNCAQRHTSESCILPIRGGGVHVDKSGSRDAVRYFTEVLERAPAETWWHVKARWLLNIAYMTLGEYPDGVPADYRIDPSVFDAPVEFPAFPEVAPALGLNLFDMSGGVIADDFDRDGLLDLFVTTADTRGSARLFLSRGDGSFVEVTREAGLEGIWGGLNANQADYDNDGDPDVLILRGAWWRHRGQHPNSLLRNNGDGTFTDVTFLAGLGEVHLPTQCAGWADYDLDGDLDLYVGNETDRNIQAPGQLFRNNGDGTFTDVAPEAGVTDVGFAKTATWGDYDGDRYPDLYVTDLGGANSLFHNEGDGTFTEVARALGVEEPFAAFPTWFWDANNDGALDLFVAGYGGRGMPPDIGFVAASYLGIPNPADLDRLYLGDGKGGFVDASKRYRLDKVTIPMGANFGDIDNDGYPDYYLGTGYPYFEGLMPNVLQVNQGGEWFADVTTPARMGHLQKGHGIAFADLDNDGDQDVYAQMGGMYPGDAFGNALYENPGFGNRWIKISLVGVRSNRSGVGARIRVVVREGDRTRSIYKLANTGGPFGSNPLRQEIGLGRADRIERLEIDWPASDTRQEFLDVGLDQWIVVTEGESSFERRPLKRFSFAD